MKRYIILFCLFVRQAVFSQNNKETSISMDNDVVPYVEQFILDGKNRGFHLRGFLLNKIDYIYFNPSIMDPEVIGFVGNDKRGFYLAPRLREDSLKLKMTIYHEIGHIIKNTKHHVCFDCDEIMAEYSPKNINLFRDAYFWNKKVDNYFNWLNEKTPSN